MGWEHALGPVKTASPDFGLMGIVNITPDSFYDGGQINSAEELARKIENLADSGADVIDIGAESTRPGAPPVSVEEEIGRLAPALAFIRERFPNLQISVDTRKAAVARAALERGALIINDVSGLQFDPALLETLAEYKPAYILTHSKGLAVNRMKRPDYKSAAAEVYEFFLNGLNKLAQAGLPESRVILDPGIGFDKTCAHNLEIIKNIRSFLDFGLPLMIGLSMKSFLKNFFGPDFDSLAQATAAASALCWREGVFWHRVHEAGRARAALSLAAAFRGDPGKSRQ